MNLCKNKKKIINLNINALHFGNHFTLICLVFGFILLKQILADGGHSPTVSDQFYTGLHLDQLVLLMIKSYSKPHEIPFLISSPDNNETLHQEMVENSQCLPELQDLTVSWCYS